MKDKNKCKDCPLEIKKNDKPICERCIYKQLAQDKDD